jgi:hypothetical protein
MDKKTTHQSLLRHNTVMVMHSATLAESNSQWLFNIVKFFPFDALTVNEIFA